MQAHEKKKAHRRKVREQIRNFQVNRPDGTWRPASSGEMAKGKAGYLQT